jgi:hypothetical protein
MKIAEDWDLKKKLENPAILQLSDMLHKNYVRAIAIVDRIQKGANTQEIALQPAEP